MPSPYFILGRFSKNTVENVKIYLQRRPGVIRYRKIAKNNFIMSIANFCCSSQLCSTLLIRTGTSGLKTDIPGGTGH